MIRKFFAVFGAVGTAALCVAIPTLLFNETRAGSGNVDAKDYSIEPVGAESAPAAAAAIGVRLVPKNEYKIHMDGAPLKIVFTPPAGVTLTKTTLGRADAKDPKARNVEFLTSAQAAAPGEHKVLAAVDFILCSKKVCKPVKAEVPIRLDVKPAAP